MNPAERLLRDYADATGLPLEPMPDLPATGTLLAARLPAAALAMGSVAAVELAANRMRKALGLETPAVTLSPDRVAASFASDRLLRIDGRPVQGFAELSGFFAAQDGWVRTHANYPHHRSRLLTALGLPADAGRDTLVGRLGTRTAQEVEDSAAEVGAIAVRVRTEDEWTASPPGIAAAKGPLVRVGTRADVAMLTERAVRADQPLRGIRVLDLTRVIAGPVATRTLALLGAEVLRIDPPHLPEIAAQHVDTGQGKTTALLDLRDQAGRRTLGDLLDGADVLVTGYRPGALDRFGLDDAAGPGLVTGRVSAWGGTGPWEHRRGFDSIVQAASGIALVEGGETPGALPAQALDHASGYLLAAAVVDALTARSRDGRGRDVSVSLARTAAWLLAADGRVPEAREATLPAPETLVTHGGNTTARPALAGYADYPHPARPWGADQPGWR